jgi:hypothetical protein
VPLESFLELFSEYVAHFRYSLETVSQHLLGVTCLLAHLESHVHDRLARVRYRVGTEFDIIVFDNYIPQQVAECVIFVQERISGARVV